MSSSPSPRPSGGADPTAEDRPAAGEPADAGGRRAWRRGLRLIAALLAVWFAASLGLGVLFAAPLNEVRFFGFPLGFWFAQQGAILIFLALLVVNAVAMDRIEREPEEPGPDADANRSGPADADAP